MKPKYFSPPRDFDFAADAFSLTGEAAIEIRPAPRPFQAAPLELFIDQTTTQNLRAVRRSELTKEA